MAQFYFDYRHHNGQLDADEAGIEMPSIEAAYLAAYHAAIRHVG